MAMKRLATLLALLLAFALLPGAASARSKSKATKTPKEPSVTPVVVADDDWILSAGEKVPATSGTVVVLEFWATWCGPCLSAMPEVQALHERYAKDGVSVIAVTDQDRATVAPFVKNQGWTLPIALDGEKIVEDYRVRALPTTIVLAKDGTVAYKGSPDGVEPAIRKALGLADAAPVPEPDHAPAK